MPATLADGSAVAVCRASREDLHGAVAAARKAQPQWIALSAARRGQILYHLAGTIESRGPALAAELAASTGGPLRAATAEVHRSADRLVHLAGWTDKLAQVFGTVNPVAGPYGNVSSPVPVGVVAAFAPDAPPLLAAATLIGNALVSGNACVLIGSERHPLPCLSLAEAVATSEIPAGVVNILTGLRSELAPAAADHRDINAVVDGSGLPDIGRVLRAGTAVNCKRVAVLSADCRWQDPAAASAPDGLLELTDTRTVWHPARG